MTIGLLSLAVKNIIGEPSFGSMLVVTFTLPSTVPLAL